MAQMEMLTPENGKGRRRSSLDDPSEFRKLYDLENF